MNSTFQKSPADTAAILAEPPQLPGPSHSVVMSRTVSVLSERATPQVSDKTVSHLGLTHRVGARISLRPPRAWVRTPSLPRLHLCCRRSEPAAATTRLRTNLVPPLPSAWVTPPSSRTIFATPSRSYVMANPSATRHDPTICIGHAQARLSIFWRSVMATPWVLRTPTFGSALTSVRVMLSLCWRNSFQTPQLHEQKPDRKHNWALTGTVFL
ncbi:uncharacterized protein LOC113931236 [Zalophus californianus]|uniref:Uncharacterized protein LOC113931236 n=1 Tax=Zalophus californianus TaxID=9704 RepID=A0A6P9F5V2_ZALCA|nr:uncharacterized protein LOC113931236 [Zalophus californianus]